MSECSLFFNENKHTLYTSIYIGCPKVCTFGGDDFVCVCVCVCVILSLSKSLMTSFSKSKADLVCEGLLVAVSVYSQPKPCY